MGAPPARRNISACLYFSRGLLPLYYRYAGYDTGTSIEWRFKLRTKKIYLHEADEYVGPFRSLKDAERFIALMEWFGESSEGIEIVELESDGTERERRKIRPANANPVVVDAPPCCPR